MAIKPDRDRQESLCVPTKSHRKVWQKMIAVPRPDASPVMACPPHSDKTMPTPLAAAEADDNIVSPCMEVRLNINGQAYALVIDSRVTVLDALREHLDLTGAKKGCDHGQCGACTVLINGRRANACLSLAVMHDGHAVTTIEGLSSGDQLQPMQAEFLAHDGFQCGYCTPGQICSAVAMLGEARAGMPSDVTPDLNGGFSPLSDKEIRERMSGNLCRCSAYPNIVAAIRAVMVKTM